MEIDDLVVHYSRGDASSMITIVVFAILSILAVGFVLFCVTYTSIQLVLIRRSSNASVRSRTFFQTQLGAYTISLLISNLLMSIAFILDIRWIEVGRVETGGLCTLQATISQLGNTANAYFTAAIAIHAFNSLAIGIRFPVWLCGSAVGLGWVIALVIGIIPLAILNMKSGPVYGPDGLSCTISLHYPAVRVLFRLIPIFLAVVVSAVFYILIFLILRGTLVLQHGVRVNIQEEARRSSINSPGSDSEYHRFIVTISRSLFGYPVAFLILLIPTIAMDLAAVGRDHIPFWVLILGNTTSAMFGLVNALILMNTLRILRPFLAWPGVTSLDSDSESFFAPSSSPIERGDRSLLENQHDQESSRKARSPCKIQETLRQSVASMTLPFAPSQQSEEQRLLGSLVSMANSATQTPVTISSNMRKDSHASPALPSVSIPPFPALQAVINVPKPTYARIPQRRSLGLPPNVNVQPGPPLRSSPKHRSSPPSVTPHSMLVSAIGNTADKSANEDNEAPGPELHACKGVPTIKVATSLEIIRGGSSSSPSRKPLGARSLPGSRSASVMNVSLYPGLPPNPRALKLAVPAKSIAATLTPVLIREQGDAAPITPAHIAEQIEPRRLDPRDASATSVGAGAGATPSLPPSERHPKVPAAIRPISALSSTYLRPRPIPLILHGPTERRVPVVSDASSKTHRRASAGQPSQSLLAPKLSLRTQRSHPRLNLSPNGYF